MEVDDIVITGTMLRDAFISGANAIGNARQQIDALNVFPVPDGDTGTNMSMTMFAAKRELEKLHNGAQAYETANVAAAACLRGARGNSGVILSLLLRGFSKGVAGKNEITLEEMSAALSMGVETAYKAVMKPTEGTILTVARVAAEQAKQSSQAGAEMPVFWDEVLFAANEALESTPDMLPVLKKAGVVDAGGKGYVAFLTGMQALLCDGVTVASERRKPAEAAAEPYAAANEYDGEILFTYCTEYIITKTDHSADTLPLRTYFESIGDSVVVADDDTIIKCHVHTDNPGHALQEGLKFGTLHNLKIENMREQAEVKKSEARARTEKYEYRPVDPDREVGFVAVAAGAGLEGLFLNLGADKIVMGGQTMNPSTEDILKAIHSTPAKIVVVLPNNKNIILAAEQTVSLADREVYVLQTRSIPQGLAAMLAYDPEIGMKQNRLNMIKAFERVGTGLITFAARDSEYDGHKINRGELLALENGKLCFTDKSVSKALLKLTRFLLKKHESDAAFVTLIYGEDVPDERAEEEFNLLASKMPDGIEVSLVNGGQPVYHYIISVE